MSWDIYGNPLPRGHCEVHPHVHEEYPCSMCLTEQQRSQAIRPGIDTDPLLEIAMLENQRDELLAALKEGRRAIGEHFAPNDCYATGPMTGDEFRDLVQCPACSFIAMYDEVIAKTKGGAA
ncbi:hypothetical protein ACK3YO_12635 [Aeromonas caviae]